jgi:hypothetical protein
VSGNDDAAVRIGDDDVAGKHRRVAAADRHVEVDRLVPRKVGGRRRASVERRNIEPGDLGRIVRNPPSVTMPATPRTCRRVTRMLPAEAARGFLRLSTTNTASGGHLSMTLRCGATFDTPSRWACYLFEIRRGRSAINRSPNRAALSGQRSPPAKKYPLPGSSRIRQ